MIKRILTRGVEEIIVKSHLEGLLRSGKKLRVKLGIDPTKSDIHLGHTVILRKLKQFQDAGHKIILIIGDFTAQIGDPSGQSAERQPLTEKEVKYNLKNYIRMAGNVINVKKAEVRYNGEWHKQGLKNFLAMTKAVSISQVMKREDFQKRLNAGGDVTVLESLYAILQGYDSVVIKADVELGGTDQKLNLLMGRRLQRHFGLPEQDIMILPLIEGTDGVRKMSKSYGNTIPLFATRGEIEDAVMSIVTDSNVTGAGGIPPNIYNIHKLFKNEADLTPLYDAHKGQYKALKEALIEDIDAFLKPMRERRAQLKINTDKVLEILKNGAERAGKQADAKLLEVKKIIGVTP